ncbi:hypothetical protein [Streptomyces sp. NPDC004629]
MKPDGERGDDIAANVLLANDPEEPVYEPDDTDRQDGTSTPIAAVTYAK